MAKANVILPNGTKVDIDGTAEEIAKLLNQIAQTPPSDVSHSPRSKKRKAVPIPRKSPDGSVKNLIGGLANEGYFKTKRPLADIQKKLEELGHIYPITSISPCLTRMTKRRVLRRLKEDKVWVYVN